MSDAKKLPIESSALLVIDVQDSFKATPERWARRSNPDFEANVGRLIDAYRQAELPVIFVLHTDDDEPFSQTSPYFKLMDFIAPRAQERVLVKTTRNAFTSTDLQQILDKGGVRRLAITGIQTEQCCETSARLAADLGYDVDFVMDGTLTFPILNRATGEELSTEDIRHRTEFMLRERFARITPADDLVGELRQATTALAGELGTR